MLDGLDLDVGAGECVALVGPSGCGKSTFCRALLDLLPAGSRRTGSIRWQGRELTDDRAAWHAVRGCGIGLVLQDHRHALDPVRRVGAQVAEILARLRPGANRADLDRGVLDLFAEVRLPDPHQLADRYPHQLSGGQRQRVCLAAALAAGPGLLLADEPTTALDLMVQRDLIGLLAGLSQRHGHALLLVSHDRDLVDLLTDRVVTLGEGGTPVAGATAPAAAPTPGQQAAPVVLRVSGAAVAVEARGRRRTIVHDVDLDLYAGRTLGLAGESGAGKTTLSRALAGWLPLHAGRVELAGEADLSAVDRRRAIQLVSQDPAAALDPRQRSLDAVVEAARAAGFAGSEAEDRARALLREVDLDPGLADRRPAALSGGQRQRVQLARALAAGPVVLIADEPASSLDPDRRQRLFGLLRRVQRERDLALMLVSHDLGVLEKWCDRVALMLDGRVVELYRPGCVDQPRHPFARDLAAAAPANLTRPSTGAPLALGIPETNQQPTPDGCPYAHRCVLVQPACRTGLPALRDMGEGHLLRCPEADRQAR